MVFGTNMLHLSRLLKIENVLFLFDVTTSCIQFKEELRNNIICLVEWGANVRDTLLETLGENQLSLMLLFLQIAFAELRLVLLKYVFHADKKKE